MLTKGDQRNDLNKPAKNNMVLAVIFLIVGTIYHIGRAIDEIKEGDIAGLIRISGVISVISPIIFYAWLLDTLPYNHPIKEWIYYHSSFLPLMLILFSMVVLFIVSYYLLKFIFRNTFKREEKRENERSGTQERPIEEYEALKEFKVNEKIFFCAKIYEKWGVVDLNAKILLPCIYHDIVYFENGILGILKGQVGLAKLNEKTNSVDILLDCMFNEARKVENNENYQVEVKIFDTWHPVRIKQNNNSQIEIFMSDTWYYGSRNDLAIFINNKKEEREIIKNQILEKEKKKQEGLRKKQLEAQIKAEMMEQGIISTDDDTNNFREPIPQDIQDKVWNRDGGKCVKCGSQEKLEFDHIIPFSKGGSNTYRNLQILCEKCNRSKRNNIG